MLSRSDADTIGQKFAANILAKMHIALSGKPADIGFSRKMDRIERLLERHIRQHGIFGDIYELKKLANEGKITPAQKRIIRLERVMMFRRLMPREISNKFMFYEKDARKEYPECALALDLNDLIFGVNNLFRYSEILPDRYETVSKNKEACKRLFDLTEGDMKYLLGTVGKFIGKGKRN
ncbi:MAG: hypothetical protein V1676_00555 [Candidatus Diapherotrites archaeon]